MDDKSFQRAVRNQRRYVKALEDERGDGLLWALLVFFACFALTLFAVGKLFRLL